jgi:hypothetical protein
MAAVEALSASEITKVGVVLTVALILIGLLLSIVITKLVGRIIVLGIVVVLAVLVWQQRGHVENQIDGNSCHPTFFGFHLDVPNSLAQKCQDVTK